MEGTTHNKFLELISWIPKYIAKCDPSGTSAAYVSKM
jgi:hypothetical protein